jgi:hypothetical protein
MLQRYHPMVRVNASQLTIESKSDINQLLVKMRNNNGFFNKILGQSKTVNSVVVPIIKYNTTNYKLSQSMNNSLLQYFK